MLIYAAIGDAYGAAWEFVPHDSWPNPNTATAYHKHPEIPLGNGRYTDDAQMTSAVIEALVDFRRELLRPYNKPKIPFENYFVKAYRQDPRPGYSKGFASLLETCETGIELKNTIVNNSTRSGAAMRAAPVGLLGEISQVLDLTQQHVSVTHNTPIAIEAASAVALAVHYLVHVKGPRDQLGGFINYNLPAKLRTVDWTQDRTEWASMEAVDCARNAITAWRNATTVSQVLINAVAPGGDTDTVACIAMSIAWADKSLTDDLHVNMVADLEHEAFGFGHLFDINHTFVETYYK